VAVVSTHLKAAKGPEHDEQREAQRAELFEKVNAVVSEYSCPVIFGCDLGPMEDHKEAIAASPLMLHSAYSGHKIPVPQVERAMSSDGEEFDIGTVGSIQNDEAGASEAPEDEVLDLDAIRAQVQSKMEEMEAKFDLMPKEFPSPCSESPSPSKEPAPETPVAAGEAEEVWTSINVSEGFHTTHDETDHILFSIRDFRVVALWSLPERSHEGILMLPSTAYPSDHLAIMARFAKQHK